MKTKNFNLLRIALNAGLSKERIRKKDFSSADFRYANFRSADFSSANFSSADFRYANFSSANFSSANFSSANFSSADFRSANLNFIINNCSFGFTINCPEEGSFIGYKKARGKIIKLLIHEDAKRSSATTYKCRASKATCLEIEGGITEIQSDYSETFIYRVGETVDVANFDENRWNECSTGIHFFMSRKMAEQYS